MNDRCEIEDMPLENHLAAPVMLLTVSTIHGPTSAKLAAVRSHLRKAAGQPGLSMPLRRALEQSLAIWTTVECHPGSISAPACAMLDASRSVH
jgi:hypothetical protein